LARLMLDEHIKLRAQLGKFKIYLDIYTDIPSHPYNR
jgi:hypothetical protein